MTYSFLPSIEDENLNNDGEPPLHDAAENDPNSHHNLQATLHKDISEGVGMAARQNMDETRPELQ